IGGCWHSWSCVAVVRWIVRSRAARRHLSRRDQGCDGTKAASPASGQALTTSLLLHDLADHALDRRPCGGNGRGHVKINLMWGQGKLPPAPQRPPFGQITSPISAPALTMTSPTSPKHTPLAPSTSPRKPP